MLGMILCSDNGKEFGRGLWFDIIIFKLFLGMVFLKLVEVELFCCGLRCVSKFNVVSKLGVLCINYLKVLY